MQLLNQLQESVDFTVVDFDRRFVLVVDRPVAKLQELSSQNSRTAGGYRVLVHLQKQLRLKLCVGFCRRSVKSYRHIVHQHIRQGQVVRCFHADADVADGLLNHLETAVLWRVIENCRAVSPAGDEVFVPISAEGLAQPCAAVQEINLRPQILKPVAGRSTRQLHDALYSAAHQLQGFEPLALGVLETGTFIQYHHVKRPRIFEMLDQPLHVLTIHHIDIRRRSQSTDTLLRCTENRNDPHHFQVLPLLRLRSPRGLRNLFRCDDEGL